MSQKKYIFRIGKYKEEIKQIFCLFQPNKFSITDKSLQPIYILHFKIKRTKSQTNKNITIITLPKKKKKNIKTQNTSD